MKDVTVSGKSWVDRKKSKLVAKHFDLRTLFLKISVTSSIWRTHKGVEF